MCLWLWTQPIDVKYGMREWHVSRGSSLTFIFNFQDLYYYRCNNSISISNNNGNSKIWLQS